MSASRPLLAIPNRSVVLDGGLATELERRGCDVSGPLWSAAVLNSAPQIIEQVHFDYLMAGAECITTASYQISFEGFAEVGWSAADTITALRQSVQIAESARTRYLDIYNRRPWIAASVGPYGAILHDGSEFRGNYSCSFQQLVDFHVSRLRVLATTNVDLLACETVPSLQEAVAIVTALREFHDLIAWVTFTCSDGLHTGYGDLVSECASLLDRESQVVAIGVNCTAPHLVSSLIRELRRNTDKPIVAYPNSGETWDGVHRRWTGTAEDVDFGTLAGEWRSVGARWIGGCCRTRPSHIQKIRDAIKA